MSSNKKKGCSEYRKNKIPKCKDQDACEWIVKKGCSKLSKNGKKSKKLLGKLNHGLEQINDLRRLLIEDSKYIDNEELVSYLYFSMDSALKYLKAHPTYTIGEISKLLHEDFFSLSRKYGKMSV